MDRLEREGQTIEVMIKLYCKKNHRKDSEICESCSNLLSYALKRVDACTLKDKKPACAKCKIHCYNNEMRNQVKKVMRFSGPRMIFHHPILTMKHLIDRLYFK